MSGVFFCFLCLVGCTTTEEGSMEEFLNACSEKCLKRGMGIRASLSLRKKECVCDVDSKYL